jgi:hypothetical protein
MDVLGQVCGNVNAHKDKIKKFEQVGQTMLRTKNSHHGQPSLCSANGTLDVLPCVVTSNLGEKSRLSAGIYIHIIIIEGCLRTERS